jgi:hypothetical protein
MYYKRKTTSNECLVEVVTVTGVVTVGFCLSRAKGKANGHKVADRNNR